MLFVIVLWHELGHLVTALRFGWTVQEVKLLPFGGVVEVEEAGTLPAREELWVAIAGPLQNGLLAALGWLLAQFSWIDTSFAHEFVLANVTIGLFNLLPILPLDGGRILQAWVGLGVPYYRTLLWSARISLLWSGLIVIAAFYPLLHGGLLELNWLAIGLFLCVSNWTYMRNIPYVFLRFLVRRIERTERQVAEGLLSRPIVIAADRPLSSILRLLMKEQYHLIYVMKRGRIAKVVPENAIVERFLMSRNADLQFFM